MVVKEIKTLPNNQKFGVADLKDGEDIIFAVAKSKSKTPTIDMNDMRYHGGGDTIAAGTHINIVQTDGIKTINVTASSFVGGVTGTSPIVVNNTDPTNPIVTLATGSLSTSTSGVSIGNGANSTVANVTVNIQTASGSQPGLLSSADWATFNSKQSALTLGNLTDAGTDGIVITGGTGAIIGSGASIAQHVADTTHNGYLSSTDWNTFNNKQPAGTYVTTISVATANGLSGSSSGGATPALTLNISALDATKIANGSVSNTEFQYLDGVTSAIQTQIDSKITSIADPNINALFGWDDTDNAYKFITIGSGLTYTHGTHTLSASGGGGSPGGADTNIQYNNSGAFGGSNNLEWIGDITLKTQSTYKVNGVTTFGGGTVTVNILDASTLTATSPTIFLELKAVITDTAGIMIAATGAQIIRAVYTYSGGSVTQQNTTTDYTYGNTSSSFTSSGSIIQISLPGIFLQQWAYEVTYLAV